MNDRLGLPQDSETEILIRLPVISLLRCKSVCKRWRSLISSRSFIHRYNHHESRRQRHNNYNPVICYTKGYINHRFRVGVVDGDIQTSEIIPLRFPPLCKDESWAWEDVDLEAFSKKGRKIMLGKRRNDVHVIGPINGIYCIFQRLKYKHGGTIILWNPATRSYKCIYPQVAFSFPLHLQYDICLEYMGDYRVGWPLGIHIGFGYDTTIDDFKFVVIYHWSVVFLVGCPWHIRVYNNATDSWSDIYYDEGNGTLVPQIDSEPSFCNSFVNGACHFSCTKIEPNPPKNDGNDSAEFGVFAVDMAEYTFKYMRGPPIPPDRYGQEIKTSVWVLRETIAMVAKYIKNRFIEVWIMKEYGAEDSWDLLISIPISGGFDNVVGIPNDELIFLDNGKGQLISYSLNKCDQVANYGAKNKPFGRYRGTLGVFNYVESLAPI